VTCSLCWAETASDSDPRTYFMPSGLVQDEHCYVLSLSEVKTLRSQKGRFGDCDQHN
jgi:hypothetical protein